MKNNLLNFIKPQNGCKGTAFLRYKQEFINKNIIFVNKR